MVGCSGGTACGRCARHREQRASLAVTLRQQGQETRNQTWAQKQWARPAVTLMHKLQRRAVPTASAWENITHRWVSQRAQLMRMALGTGNSGPALLSL